MGIERKIISVDIKNLQVEEYLKKELGKAEISKVEVRRTPLSTRILIYANRPGIVIGRGGENIRMLTETLKTKFGIDNPQLDIQNVDNSNLDAVIVAKQIAYALENGASYRRIGNIYIDQVMTAGAVGSEIVVGGKLSGERSRTERFTRGYIKRCGDTADRYTQEGHATAILKQGIIGVKVRIMREIPPIMLLEKEEVKPVVEEKPSEKVEEKPKVKKKKVKKVAKKKSVKKPAKKAVVKKAKKTAKKVVKKK